MLRAPAFLLALLLAVPAAAEEVSPKLAEALSTEPLISSWWFPGPDGKEAIGITYTEIEGAAGNANVNAGYFTGGPAFALAGFIPDLLGDEPRDARFLADRIEITTTMPNPGDPRCCPTGTAVWSIDRKTLAATQGK